MIRILISSCLLGERVRYHGEDAAHDAPLLRRWQGEGRLVPFCPEVEGGLGVPRPPAEIQEGDGLAVLAGQARVVSRPGDDVTQAFVHGAERALRRAEQAGARLAILVERSPSCGAGEIYDGSFSGTLREGDGVTAALLERQGIRVFNVRQLDSASGYLEQLEAAAAQP